MRKENLALARYADLLTCILSPKQVQFSANPREKKRTFSDLLSIGKYDEQPTVVMPELDGGIPFRETNSFGGPVVCVLGEKALKNEDDTLPRLELVAPLLHNSSPYALNYFPD